MTDQENNQLKPIQKKGLFERMGMFQKILIGLLIVIVLLVSVFTFFGGFGNVYQFMFYLIVFVGVVGGIYIIIKAVGIIFQPRYYSPTDDMRNKLTMLSQNFKPNNVKNLFFMGSERRQRVLAGEIIGMLGLPNYVGKIKQDKKGNIEYTGLTDFEGKKIPKFESIEINSEKNGDTLFYVRKGWFIFAKKFFIRCAMELHSELHGDVEIMDINPVPYGFYFYPYKQMQKDSALIMVQNQLETILNTHAHQHDLISQSVDSAIYFNPYMRMSIKQQAELGGDE